MRGGGLHRVLARRGFKVHRGFQGAFVAAAIGFHFRYGF